MIDKVSIVVIQYQFVYQPVWGSINNVVKAIGPGIERNGISPHCSNQRMEDRSRGLWWVLMGL